MAEEESAEPQTLKHDLWSFIRNSKATQSASFKVLQEFVSSLNKNELRHLIECYLKSMIRNHDEINGLTPKQAVEEIINNNNNNNNDMNDNDDNMMNQNILNKMHKKYGNKYNKKIVGKMQQNNIENKHILSINPEVLSYSFQYLSFKELSKIQSVCSYFTYLNKTYQGLSHYFINLNKTFCKMAIKNQINLDNLQQFKHIKISSAYCGQSRYTKDITRRTKLFDHIVKLIFNQSKTCLDKLEIDTNRTYGCYDNPFQSVLWRIINMFDYLPITHLIWTADDFWRAGDAMKSIEQTLSAKCPKLLHFVFGVVQYKGPWARYSLFRPSDAFRCIHSIVHKLQSLTLHFPTFNLFENDKKLIQTVTKIKTLKKLSICSLMNENDVTFNNKIKNVSLDKLNIEIVINDNADIQIPMNQRKSIQYILTKIFSTFVSIKHFQFGFSTKRDWNFSNRRVSSSIDFAMDWNHIFYQLFQHKISYSMHHALIPPLQSLKFNEISYDDGIDVIKALKLYVDEIYYDLKDFGMNIVYGTNGNITQNEYNTFIKDYFIPFIKLKKNDLNLKNVELEYGNGHKQHYQYQSTPCILPREKIRIKSLYFEPILNLLSNLPKSLISLKVSPASYYGSNREIKQIESRKLVKKLCEMLSEKNDESNLETIVFNQTNLCSKPKEFLTFIFGFNNKFHFENGKYHLCFT